MDAFLTPEERALRQEVRNFFRERALAGPQSKSLDSASLAAISRRLKDLGHPDFLDAGPGAGPTGLLERALIIEEVSAASPETARALFGAAEGQHGGPGGADPAVEVARAIGTAAAILETCLRAAREKGLFDSTLMNCQKAQAELANALSGLEAERLQAYRALRLLDRGDKDRGGKELGQASARVREILDEARSLLSGLLGGDGRPQKAPEQERR
jgi:alkylation response protein AidB-like acyl-CoA dehydrogenase